MNDQEEHSAQPAAPVKNSSDSPPAEATVAPQQKSNDDAPTVSSKTTPAAAEVEPSVAAPAATTAPAETTTSAATNAPAESTPPAGTLASNGASAQAATTAPAGSAPPAETTTPIATSTDKADAPAEAASTSTKTTPLPKPDPTSTTSKFQDNEPVESPEGRDTLFVMSPNATQTPTALTSSAPKSAGQTCPKCGHLNRAGILVCEKCGTLLIGDEHAGGTKRFEGEKNAAEGAAGGAQPAIMETTELFTSAITSAGSSQFTENMVLRLEIEGAPTPIMVHPKFETSLGRRDPATGTMPDVDLSAYAGYRLGVSRKHAIIRLKNNQLELYDLGSSNGTSINGTRLNPHQSQVLRNGDEVMLGKMMLRVLFQVRNRKA